MENKNIIVHIGKILDEEQTSILKKASPNLRSLLKKISVKVSLGDGSKYGDYYGTPYPKDSAFANFTYPSDINLYARAFQPLLHNEAALRQKIRIVLIHEYGHYLGLSEAELRSRNVY